MDKVMMRNQALNVAMSRANPGEPIDDLLANADRVYEWLMDGASAPTSAPAATTHESEAAVVGQEPRA